MAKYGGHHHHHRQGHGLTSSISSCFGLRRRSYVLVLLVLVGVLVLNMLLLMPQLHAPDSSGWHLVGFSSAAGRTAAAAGSDAAAAAATAAAAAGKTMKASTLQQAQQLIQQQQAQQLGKTWGAGSIAAGEFVTAFDANADGVLGPAEFKSLAQEACRNDRASLPLLQRLRRLVRLALGLSPGGGSSGSSSGGDAYPCTLAGELLDGTRQAAAALTGGGSRDAAGDGRGGGAGARGRAGGSAAGRARGAKGAAGLDPDSPEGRAAAESAALLAGCSRLTPELAAAAASADGLLLLAAADWSMFELFGVNWLAAVQKAGVDNYLIAALDQRTADFLRANKLGHCLLWSSHAGTAAAGDGPLPKQAAPYQHASPAHRAASWAKLQAGSLLLGWGYDVLLSDLDTVWLADPAPFLARAVPQAADMVLATDSPADAAAMAATEGGLLQQPQPSSAVNPAVAYLRATPASRAALAAWLAQYASAEASGDPAAAAAAAGGDDDGLPGFPAAVARAWLRQPGFAHAHPAEPGWLLQLTAARHAWLAWGSARRQVALGVFSPVAVANGYSWFVQGVGARAAAGRGRAGAAGGVPGRGLPVAVHLSRAGASREGRLHRMREAAWYADGPRYYSEPKLLGFSLQPFTHPDIDSGAAGGPGYPPSQLLALHLAALQHQLSQLYAAAAAAVALGRVLLLPQLQCFCYRDPDSSRQGPAPWLAAAGSSSSSSSSVWSCRAPGDDASVMPFNCTLDQVMSPELMYRHPAVFAGRPLNFREAGFTANARTPSWVRHAATAIRSGSPLGCEGGSKCAQVLGRKPPQGVNQQVVVPAGLTDAELVSVLAPFAAAKYLHCSDVTAVFGGFANPNHRIEYERYLDAVVQPWCCKPAAAPAAGSSEAAAAAAGEVATAVPGWAMVEVKARPGSSSGSGSQKPR